MIVTHGGFCTPFRRAPQILSLLWIYRRGRLAALLSS